MNATLTPTFARAGANGAFFGGTRCFNGLAPSVLCSANVCLPRVRGVQWDDGGQLSVRLGLGAEPGRWRYAETMKPDWQRASHLPTTSVHLMTKLTSAHILARNIFEVLTRWLGGVAQVAWFHLRSF